MLERLRETKDLLLLFFNPNKTRPQAIYDLLSTHNNLGESTRFLNLGYWKNASSYDEACSGLARLVAESANLGPTDEVLDVGFGLGDQDLLFVREFGPKHITGINITQSQVDLATSRMKDAHIEDRVTLQNASATAMPFSENAFDKLISIEAGFHFVTRERFLGEAFRVLKPGGTMSLADVVPNATAGDSPWLRRQVMDFVGRSFWQYPKENMYFIDEYVQKLKTVGFVDIEVTDISSHVFAPFKAFARKRVEHAEIRERVHPWIRALWAAPSGKAQPLSYFVIRAKKP